MDTLSNYRKQLSIPTVRSLVREGEEEGRSEIANTTVITPVQTLSWKLCILTDFSENKDFRHCKEGNVSCGRKISKAES